MKSHYLTFLILCITIMSACEENYEKGTFGYDLQYLEQYKEVVLLSSNDNQSQVAVVPDYQGRIMTSTSKGLEGKSYGWLNHGLISSKEFEEHINVFGGEDRFWLGPEGGQYSIFFEKGAEFTLDNWFTPSEIDTEPFAIVEKSKNKALFKKKMQLVNYQDYKFDIEVTRGVTIFDNQSIEQNLGIDLDEGLTCVGFQSENNMKNIGGSDWEKEKGLLSIWILGMLVPSENTTVIIPYKDSLELNTSYFGEIGADRLKVTPNTILFKGDGKYRCKLGVPPQNAMPILGSYDSKEKVLTIVKFNLEKDKDYVNSLWELQDNPYEGDVVNTYNDGPVADGSQLGPFYELESSSPAKALKVDESIMHIHQTYHFEGEFSALNGIAKKLLHMDLEQISF